MRQHPHLLNNIVWAKPSGKWIGCHIAATPKYGVNIISRGGENADKDYDPMITASRDGDSLTLTKNWACQGIGDAYLT